MAPEENDKNKMEVFNPRRASLERRARPLSAYPAPIERPPDLRAWWRIVRKRHWIVMGVFAILFGAVLAGSLEQKPVYRAKSLIEIDRENPTVFTPQELFQLDDVSDSYLETQYKVLTSDDLAERVIHQLALDRVAEFRPKARSWAWPAIGSQARTSVSVEGAAKPDLELSQAVLAKFQDHLDIRPIRRSRAVEIRFESQDPDLATRVVNAVAGNYIQKNLEARWDSAQNASVWLSQQLQDLKAKLEKSEEDLQKYAAENGLLYLETDKGSAESIINQSVRELQEELTRAQADRFEKESLFRLVQSGDYGSLPGVVDNRLLQDLSVRLADLEREHAQLAATFTEEYPRVKEIQSQIAEIQSSLDRERWRAARKISNDYFAALRREKLVQQAFGQKQGQANQFAEKSVQYGILSREVDSNKGLYDGLLQRLKEAGVSAGLKASNIRIVDPGAVSYKPVSPNLPLNLSLAAFLGLGLGVSFAFLREHLDQTVRDGEDVDHFLGLPVLGYLPRADFLNARKKNRKADSDRAVMTGMAGLSSSAAAGPLIEKQNGNYPGILNESRFVEAFRELRTSVVLSGQGRFANSILVTSALPGEGKTTVAVNLAASLARLGQPVLLVDADMRCPSIQKYFPQTGSRLSAYLAGQGAWQEMVSPTTVNRLSVLHCGPVPENPSELLSSERMQALLRESITTYRFVILDSPPLLKAADSRILGSMVEGTILVVKGGETPRQVVQFAEEQARSVGTNLIGVVLNHLDVSLNRYAYHPYSRLESTAGTA